MYSKNNRPQYSSSTRAFGVHLNRRLLTAQFTGGLLASYLLASSAWATSSKPAEVTTQPAAVTTQQAAVTTQPADAPPAAVPTQPADARPAPPAPKTRGFQLDAALAMGGVAGNARQGATPLSRLAPMVTAGAVVLGYRLDHFMLGVSALGGISSPSEQSFEICAEDGVECGTSLVRYGIQARFYPILGTRVEPWLGVGMGKELFSSQILAAGDALTVNAEGTELFNARLGMDIRVAGATPMSIFADYSMGQFTRFEVLGEKHEIPGNQRTLHHWIVVGGGISLIP